MPAGVVSAAAHDGGLGKFERTGVVFQRRLGVSPASYQDSAKAFDFLIDKFAFRIGRLSSFELAALTRR